MIQYQYYHTGQGYECNLSESKASSDYRYLKDLFESLRGNFSGNAFTYAIFDGKPIFMQVSGRESGSANSYPFAKGLLCDGLTGELPARYIDRFETSVSDEDKNSNQLPEGRLPELGRRVDDFSLAENLHHIFPKLVDALIFGDKQKSIIIVSDSRESSANYIKVLSLLLPPQFMKRVGFCIGSGSVNDKITLKRRDGSDCPVSIKIWAPNLLRFDYDLLAYSYYVFDTKSGRDNYTAELSPLAKILDSINLCDQSRALGFANAIAPAFNSDGSVRMDELDRICAELLFNARRDLDSARGILRLGSSNSVSYQATMVSAMSVMLETENAKHITPDERKLIIREYRELGYVAESLGEPLFEHMAVKYSSLNEMERDEVIKMVADDDSGDRLNRIIAGSANKDFRVLLAAFDVSLRVLKIRFERTGYSVFPNRDVIKKIIQFFDFTNIRGDVPASQHASGEEFFQLIKDRKNEQLRHIAIAILMASAYSKDSVFESRAIRIKGFKRLVASLGLSRLDQINYVISVRDRLIEISGELPELNIPNDQRDFLFNGNERSLWMDELIQTLPMDVALEADQLVKNRTNGGNFYESMSSAIRARLLNPSFVMDNIRSGYPLLSPYIEFFSLLPHDIQLSNPKIEDYLNSLDREGSISDEFERFRCNFAYDCFSTLSHSSKNRILRGESNTPFINLEKGERQRAVDATIRAFGSVAAKKKRDKSQASPSGIWAFWLSVLSGILLILPAIVQAAALGQFDITHIIQRTFAFLKPEFVFIPLYVYMLNIVSYALSEILSRGKKANIKSNSTKRAVIITLLCGILPVFIFVLSYLGFYFLDLNIEIPFLTQFFK